ncbi:MAG: hypothetical protein Q4B82_02585 [Alysiella sp.]|uniref:hypothetical protein n=1 Tax=Alysiella sp. TaxID=1872483 RepID=UPI0026DA7A2F|nr:hypothetical protein [Alysiella sp.]MDO4433453.1 hypothetical protein [Alysiella sp.]
MPQSQFSAAVLYALDTPHERQKLAIKLFNEAMENEDNATAIDVANFVIGDENCAYTFSAGFQMHCASWLARHYRQCYADTTDNSPEEDEYLEKLIDILWKFKWLIARLPYDINISQDEITQANELVTHFYEHFEYGQAALAKALMHQNIKMGNVQAVQQHFETWQNTEADWGNDCDACERNSLVEYHHFIGDYMRVIELAKPILSGEMSCGEVPHITYEFVIDSLIRTQQTEAAQDLLNEAIDLITNNIEENLHLLPSLIYLTHKVGDHDKAKDLLNDFNDAILTLAPNNRLYYLDYLICVAPFNDEAIHEAQKVAAEFDERNDNSFYQDKLTLMFGQIQVH